MPESTSQPAICSPRPRTAIVPSVRRGEQTPQQVARQFLGLLDQGASLRIAGQARHDPHGLFSAGYTPKHKLELFGTHFYLTNVRQNPELRFLVAYVVPLHRKQRRTEIYPRIFYKDLSLVWRSASHYFRDDHGLWIGKGATFDTIENGHAVETSRESTTDLPVEMQAALEDLLRWTRRPRVDERVLDLVLRRAPAGRIQPYPDFLQPRTSAAARRGNLINQGRSVARFHRPRDPSSLQFVPGYEPDFADGVIETRELRSSLYHGTVRRFRILSTNREIQYLFLAGPHHVWIIPPQATTTELSSYGVRTVDVIADEDLFIPGYEYHYTDEAEDGQSEDIHYSQIPQGFAGAECHLDDQKADASPWLEQIPVIQEFRRKVLGQTMRAR